MFFPLEIDPLEMLLIKTYRYQVILVFVSRKCVYFALIPEQCIQEVQNAR